MDTPPARLHIGGVYRSCCVPRLPLISYEGGRALQWQMRV